MKILKTKKCKIWLRVSIALILVFALITVLACTLFFEVLNSIIGGKRPVFANGVETVYYSDYESKAETLMKANEFNEQMCEEGFVLLKNKNNALPIYTPISDKSVGIKPKISIFGKNSVNIVTGGSGSGGGGGGEYAKTVYDSLNSAGFDTNGLLKEFYENEDLSGKNRPSKPVNSNLDDGKTVSIATYETPLSKYDGGIENYIRDYDDAALVIFSRMGGEGFDLPRSMKGVVGAENDNDHYLELDHNEKELLYAVCEAFNDSPVIVLINTGTSMEVGFLEDENIDVDAALWIGFPGDSGIMALGRILNGSVSPSGRTVDTYSSDFKSDPTWQNFGDNLITADSKTGVLGGDQYATQDGSGNTKAQPYYFVDYEEGIYVGYKYYETRFITDGAEWYDDNVVYPYGYGLSYTDFEWSIEDDSSIRDKIISADDKYKIKIAVKNVGNKSGRDVVELFGSLPYYSGEIEKPAKVLIDFGKTDILEPGSTQILTLTVDPYYLSSYDYNDANGNGFCGYELDGGNYSLCVSTDAHNERFSIPFSVDDKGITYTNDPVSGKCVKNRYTDQNDLYFNSDLQLSDVQVNGQTRKGLSRSDWELTWPVSRDKDRVQDNSFFYALKDISHNNIEDFSDVEMPYFDEPITLLLRDMVTNESGVYGISKGADTWKAYVKFDDSRWNILLNECSSADLLNMYNYGAFKSDGILEIGKPMTNDTDGPSGFVNFLLKDGTYHNTCYYACPMVLASSWSTKLAFEYGKMIGNEGIWGADGRGNGLSYSGWYAPGVNIHRSPFGGRNFEYYSEDGLFTGIMAASQVRGTQSKGVYSFIKHFALNDQETHRSNNGVCVWATEQSMREIYLKSFEIAVKNGESRAVMSSFNRIGTRWTGGDYRLISEILRNEWGFNGTVICDFNSGSYMNARQMAYAGGDLNLNNRPDYIWSDFDAGSIEDALILRRCAKNVFYTVVNSNAMNGEILGYNMPIWQIGLIVFDILLVLGLAVWGFFAIKNAGKTI